MTISLHLTKIEHEINVQTTTSLTVNYFASYCRPLSFIGLFLIGLGTGGIKPCVSAFGGEQFKIPEQSKYIATFFSIFYASINLGSMFITILTPILRQEVKCFGQDSCFPLAFGVPCVLMIASVCKYMQNYDIYPPCNNIF